MLLGSVFHGKTETLYDVSFFGKSIYHSPSRLGYLGGKNDMRARCRRLVLWKCLEAKLREKILFVKFGEKEISPWPLVLQ